MARADQEKENLLRESGYDFLFRRQLYFNSDARKVFSAEVVADHDANWLQSRMSEDTPPAQWRFYSNSPLTPEAQAAILSELGVDYAIRKLRSTLPASVLDVRFEVDNDAEGQQAVWVWIIVDDATQAWSLENRDSIRRKVLQELAAAGVADWVHVRFRSASEEADTP